MRSVTRPRRRTDRVRRVLLLDEGWFSTLYVAEGLRARGFAPTILSARDAGSGGHIGVLPPVESAEYLDVVGAICVERQFDHILPLTEPILYRIWDASPEWESAVFPATATWQRELLRDKSRLSEFVAARGVRIPPLRRVQAAEDVPDAVAALGLPLVVKGTTGNAGATVSFVHDVAAATELVARAVEQGEVPPFLQQCIDGPTLLVAGLFHDGVPIRLYAAEMVETYPVRTGPSIRHRTTTDPRLLAAARQVFRALQWTGIAESNWIRGADGGYYFLEVNPRPWGSIAAPSTVGVDIFTPFAALLDGDVPDADPAFPPDVDTALFPQYLRARIRGVREQSLGLRELIADRRLLQGAPWGKPRLMARIVRRLYGSMRERPARAEPVSVHGGVSVRPARAGRTERISPEA